MSLIGALGYFCLATVAMQYILYVSFVHTGQAFLSFQWDILLLELACVSALAAPLFPSKRCVGLRGHSPCIMQTVCLLYCLLPWQCATTQAGYGHAGECGLGLAPGPVQVHVSERRCQAPIGMVRSRDGQQAMDSPNIESEWPPATTHY